LVKRFNMDKNKILDIVNNVENKSNKELLEVESLLFDEYEKIEKRKTA